MNARRVSSKWQHWLAKLGYRSRTLQPCAEPSALTDVAPVNHQQWLELNRRHAQLQEQHKSLLLWGSVEQQRHSRRLQQANAQLAAFNYMVSHDLRASLRVLAGMISLLRDNAAHESAETIQADVERVQLAVKRMQAMVAELLKLAELDSRELQRCTVDVSALAGEIIRDLEFLSPDRAVTVNLVSPLYAQAEPVLLREALQNLLSNAWKFTARRVDACIELAVMQVDGEPVYQVRDNGVGFDMRQAEELFKPFRRLHAATDFEGTGVGLTIVKRIVERHGGRIWAEGFPGQGALISFTLGESAHDAADYAQCCANQG